MRLKKINAGVRDISRKKILGIRREDKNRWERRVPLIPEDLRELREKFGIEAVVQPSQIRVYPDDDYREHGAGVDENFDQAVTIFAVKEIPTDLLAENKTYIYFSHTIKGQPFNMNMLRRLMELKCNLIDYERIVDEQNRRLIFFSVHAGCSGIVETLHAFARKTELSGIRTPLSDLKQAYEYENLEHARQHLAEIGKQISKNGLPENICPLVVGFAGYGNVAKGAQELFDILPVRTISPEDLAGLKNGAEKDSHVLYKVVFREEDMVQPVSGAFDLQDYFDHPEKYRSVMEKHLPFLDILVNCIFWTPKYPRIVTKKYLKEQYEKTGKTRPSVVGDISCDIEGSIEITQKSTMPDNPCFTYFPDGDSFVDKIDKNGVTVMAVDNLPCEFPKESSMFFSKVLKGFVNDIVSADFSLSYDQLDLAFPIKKALILHNGRLTKDYEYMKAFLKNRGHNTD